MSSPILSPYKRAKIKETLKEPDFVTTDDFRRAIPKLSQFVTRACEVAITRVTQVKQEVFQAHTRLRNELTARITAAERAAKATLTDARAYTDRTAAQIRGEIPEPADLSEMETRLRSAESIRDLVTADNLRNMLELLDGDDRLDASAIKGIDELVKELVPAGSYTGPLGPTGRDIFMDIDLSGQLDGATKTFNIPAVWNIISVHLSSFPHALRKNVDFTYTPTTITFTDQIDAATTLAEGQTCVLTAVTA